MSTPVVVTEGIVKADGTLELSAKLSLPPGRVQVTVVPVPELPEEDPFWKRMQAIWNSHRARGHTPRSVAEVKAERQHMRAEWDERMRRIEQIQAEAEQV